MYKKFQLELMQHAIENYIEFDNEHSLDDSIEAYLEDSFDIITQMILETKKEIVEQAKKDILAIRVDSIEDLLEKVKNYVN